MNNDLTTQEVADKFGVTGAAVRGWRLAGKCTGHMRGHSWFYPAAQFIGWAPVDRRIAACKRRGVEIRKAKKGRKR